MMHPAGCACEFPVFNINFFTVCLTNLSTFHWYFPLLFDLIWFYLFILWRGGGGGVIYIVLHKQNAAFWFSFDHFFPPLNKLANDYLYMQNAFIPTCPFRQVQSTLPKSNLLGLKK